MDMTLTLGDACLILIVFLLAIFLLYLISMAKNAIPSIKSLAKIMENVEVITEAAAKGSVEAEAVLADITEVTSSVVKSVKAQTGIIGQLTSVATAVNTIAGIFSRKEKEKE